jgi:hypothetical protein
MHILVVLLHVVAAVVLNVLIVAGIVHRWVRLFTYRGRGSSPAAGAASYDRRAGAVVRWAHRRDEVRWRGQSQSQDEHP